MLFRQQRAAQQVVFGPVGTGGGPPAIQYWLESCPQAYLSDTEYGHQPGEEDQSKQQLLVNPRANGHDQSGEDAPVAGGCRGQAEETGQQASDSPGGWNDLRGHGFRASTGG